MALLLHAALLTGVWRTRQPEAETPGATMLWLKMVPPVPKPVFAAPVVRQLPRSIHQQASTPARAAPAPPIAAREAAPDIDTPPAHASTEKMISAAKRAVGNIDKELRKEEGKERLRASDETQRQRLDRLFEQAHDAAPLKWYEAAKIVDITPPGDDARKIYRVITGLGSYCVFYPDKNRMPQSGAANPGAPKTGACPHMF